MIKVLVVFVAAIAAMVYFLSPTLFKPKPTVANSTATSSFVRLASLPGEINESSGIEALKIGGEYLTHNDAGNRPYLYKINHKAEIVDVIKLKLPNVDWEDLAHDKKGNIYIADTGNNNNRRKELAIYKVNLKHPDKPQAIRFTYEDQKEYPPKPEDRNFDCEAVFWHQGSLYLVSKDRGRETTAKVYHLPDKPGEYVAKLIGKHDLNTMVTGATISPDGNTVVLLSEGRLHLFTGYPSAAKFYKGKYKQLRLKDAGQTEGVAFEENKSLIITSEGGNLYRYTLK